jgi:CheY-like chemotaxis protein
MRTISRTLAIAVREIVPTLVRRRQSYTFSEHRCAWTIRDDRMVETSFQRLGLCASDLLKQGFIAFDARARALRSGGCTLSLRVAGAGPLRQAADVDEMLASFGLVRAAETGGSAGGDGAGTGSSAHPTPQLVRAHGICPATRAQIDFAGLPLAGFVFNANYTFREACAVDAGAGDGLPAVDGGAPRLWLLQPDTLNAASVVAQAQGHGWAVSAFTSALQVQQRLRRLAPPQARPGVFVCFLRDVASAEEAIGLSYLLPHATHRIGAIELGAGWPMRGELAAAYELACHPFCHDDWSAWTAALANRSDQPSGSTEPAPLAIEDRIVIQIVDDDEFSRELTGAMVHALGYDSVVAGNGEEAIECCRREGPVLVLMDLEMPVMDGYETIRRLRALQQAGSIAMCRIVAYSSLEGPDAVRQAFIAGADTFLAKPVPLDALRAELERWCASRRLPHMFAAPPPGEETA